MARQKKYKGYLRKRFTVSGKSYEVYAKTAAELLEKEIEKRQKLEGETQEIYNPTLYQYYDHFTNIRRREIRESTLRTQSCQFHTVAGAKITENKALGDLPIRDITRKNIEKARQQLLDQGQTPQNLNNIFAHLNHVFNSAVLDDTIPKNPCKCLKQLKRETPLIGENKHRALTPEEKRAFFESARERDSYYLHIFEIMALTGMRVGEVCALYPEDIDRINGFIHVRRTITRDEAGGYVVGDYPKTNSGIRDIPLTADMINVIRQQQELNAAFFGLSITKALIFRSFEDKILREYSVNREIGRICKAAGIEKFTCHSFRVTFATEFIEQRPQDYKVLSEILGHKDINITLNLYTQVMTERKVQAMKEFKVKIS